MIKIALFPIPDCVTFPGIAFPLHVFEPRYREMIKYCEDNTTLLGVCHTQKTVSPAKPVQSMEENLQSNQATYKPFQIFSAGHCEQIERLSDGRILLEVNIQQRYKAIEELQTLPFTLFDCEIYSDVPMSELQFNESKLLQQKILTRLIAMTNQYPEIVALLNSQEWQNMASIEFSFRLFGLLKLGAEIQQSILEMRSPVERLSHALELLNQ